MENKFCTYETVNKVNNKYYRGYCSDYKRIERCEYYGSGKLLHYAIRKYGLENFECTILQRFATSKEAYAHEKEIVVPKSIDQNSYNIVFGGFGNWHAANQMHKDHKLLEINNTRKFVHKSKVREYILNGYHVYASIRGRKTMYNPVTAQRKIITTDKYSEYIANGWLHGQYEKTYPSTDNKICMYNAETKRHLYVERQEVELYLLIGWIKGRHDISSTLYTNWMYNPETSENRLIKPENQQDKLLVGWKYGHVKKRHTEKCYINDGVISKLVRKSLLQSHISIGWKIGRIKLDIANHIWIHNQVTNRSRLVKIDVVDDFIIKGWKFGKAESYNSNRHGCRLRGRKAIYNESTGAIKYIKGDDILKYLEANMNCKLLAESSYVRQATKHAFVYKNGKSIYIELCDIDAYILAGWSRGLKPSHSAAMRNLRTIHNKELRKSIRVHVDTLDIYYETGWEPGLLPNKSRIGSASDKSWIYNTTTNSEIYVRNESVKQFLADNSEYRKGRNPLSQHTLGKVWIYHPTNGQKRKAISSDKLEQYKLDGWLEGLGKTNRTAIVDQSNRKWLHHPETNDAKFVNPDEYYELLEHGYVFGMKKRTRPTVKGRKTICTYDETLQKYINKCVDESELETYLSAGWKLGSGHKSTQNTKWMHNPETGIRKCVKHDQVDKYLTNGFIIGVGPKNKHKK